MAQSNQSDFKAKPDKALKLKKRIPSSHHKIGSKHPSPAFLSKCVKEQQKLRFKIVNELQCHILELYDSEQFADISIFKGKAIKSVHSCVLIARTPHFYEQLIRYNKCRFGSESVLNEKTIYQCIQIPHELEESSLLLFLKRVYSGEDINAEERELVHKLKCFTQHLIRQKAISNPKMNAFIKNTEKCESESSLNSSEDILDDISDISLEKNESKKTHKTFDCDLDKSDLYYEEITKNHKSEQLISGEERQGIKDICSHECNHKELTNNFIFNDNLKEQINNKTSQMVRSGTFELLSSINSEDKDLNETIDSLQSSSEKSFQTTDRNETSNETFDKQMESKLFNNSFDKLSDEERECERKQSNSMFSLFIDIKSLSENKLSQNKLSQQNNCNKVNSNCLQFIPINQSKKVDNSRHSQNENKPEFLRRNKRLSSKIANKTTDSRQLISENCLKTNSNSMIRSLDSLLAKDVFEEKNNEMRNNIPSLPMGSIFDERESATTLNTNNNNDFVKHLSKKRSSTEPQDINALTFPRRSIDSLTNISTDERYVSPLRTLCPNFNLGVESSSASIHSFSDESESLGSDPSEVNSLNNKDSLNKNYINNESEVKDFLLKRTLESCSKLGEDLLRMFVEEINSDIIIKVDEKEIKAHKCIIVSRCPYFEAMLRGNWRESESNCINLKGFSYNSIYFALCHLYSGTVSVPTDQIDLSELALLSELLAMDSLKEVVVHELKMNYCHFFHNPCGDNCINGVIDCLALCYRCGLKDLYEQCLVWIAKHFSRVWSHKVFASMSSQLIESCYRSKLNQLSPDNVLKSTLECEQLITSLPRVKWAEPVFSLLAKLMEECCNFIAANYDLVITSREFQSLGRTNSWNISSLEQTLLASMTKLIPDIACKSHIQLNNIQLVQTNHQTGFGFGPFNEPFVKLVSKMQRYCERYMIQNANSVVHCESWSLMSSEAQQRIKDAAVLVFEFEKATAPPPKLTSSQIRVSVKKSAEKLNQEMSKDCSKGAVSKHFNNNKYKISGITAKKINHKSEEHIYDLVPFEKVNTNYNKYNKKADKSDHFITSNKPLKQQELSRRKNNEKIAKVVPFTINKPISNDSKPINSNNCDNTMNVVKVDDLVAEIDAETNLVTHCLQEAELLEQELTRKLHKNMTTIAESEPITKQKPTFHSKSIHLKTSNSSRTQSQDSKHSKVKSGSLRSNNTRSQHK